MTRCKWFAAKRPLCCSGGCTLLLMSYKHPKFVNLSHQGAFADTCAPKRSFHSSITVLIHPRDIVPRFFYPRGKLLLFIPQGQLWCTLRLEFELPSHLCRLSTNLPLLPREAEASKFELVLILSKLHPLQSEDDAWVSLATLQWRKILNASTQVAAYIHHSTYYERKISTLRHSYAFQDKHTAYGHHKTYPKW